MSFVRSEGSRPDPSEQSGRQIIKWQRGARSDRIADATLACPHCDAPVAMTGRLALTDTLTCSYCAHHAPARDFLSLEHPTRARRVVVRVGLRVS